MKKQVDLDRMQAAKDTVFSPNKYRLDDRFVIRDGKKHPLAIIVPGGGYFLVANFIEGVPIAKKLNQKGISAIIVYYRVRGKAKFPAPIDDLATAVREIMAKAGEYSVETENYSISGASAGGHLAACFGTDNMGYKKYKLPKPGALILSYPVISMTKELTHKGSHDNLIGKNATPEMEKLTSVEEHVHSDYPATYIWCSDDDETVKYENTNVMVAALKKAGIPARCEIFRGVAHGAGPATGTAAEGWIDKAVNFWMAQCE